MVFLNAVFLSETVHVHVHKVFPASVYPFGWLTGNAHDVLAILIPLVTDIEDHTDLWMIDLIKSSQYVFHAAILNDDARIGILNVSRKLQVGLLPYGVVRIAHTHVRAPHVTSQFEHRVNLPAAVVHEPLSLTFRFDAFESCRPRVIRGHFYPT